MRINCCFSSKEIQQDMITRLTSDIRRLFVDLKQEPLEKTFRRLRNRFFKVTKYIIYYLDLTKEIKQLDPLPGDIEVKEVSRKDLAYLRKDAQGLPSDFYRDVIGIEERCFIGIVKGDLAFIIWTSSKDSSGLIHITQGTVEMNFAYCLPLYRGKQLYFRAIQCLSHNHKRDGTKGVWAVPDSGNSVSISYIEKAGFNKVGELYRWGFFTWLKNSREPLAGAVGHGENK